MSDEFMSLLATLKKKDSFLRVMKSFFFYFITYQNLPTCLTYLLILLYTTYIVVLIPGRVIPKTEKMVHDATLFNTQPYKVRIKSKVEQTMELCSTLPYTWV